MSLSDPFHVESPPPSEEPTCPIMLPVPPGAERGTKPERCGQPAPFIIRVRDKVLDSVAEVPACAKHKGEHDERAMSLRNARKRSSNLPKSA